MDDLLNFEAAVVALPQLRACLDERGAEFRRLQELIVALGYGETVHEAESGAVPQPAGDGYELPPALRRLFDNQAAEESERAKRDARIQQVRDGLQRR